ncbi:MAG: radical SAM protein [Spirochaetes bacterium]|nr:radical SAM protein [Spirochaetota bacterium]
MINYEGTVIRPPSEAGSFIFQITLGCSDNECTFCPAYKDKTFRIKDIDTIRKEMRSVSENYPEIRKIFLADGDAVIIPQNKLIEILITAMKFFPKLSRIGIYGSAKSLENKTIDELIELKKHKLGIIYLGIETGDPEVYTSIKKYGTPKHNKRECLKVKESRIKLNTTIILGLGGKKLSNNHAVNTAKLLNDIKPDQIAALTLMIVEGTPIHGLQQSGEFELPDELDMIYELKTIIENMEDFKCQFFSNHASNYFPIQARFPKDKESVLLELDKVIKTHDRSVLRPEFLRGL